MNRNLTAIILVIIGVGVYFMVTRSMMADANLVKVKNDQLALALNNAEEIIKSREAVVAQYTSISKEDRDKLDKMIPSAVDNIRLVIDLNNLAKSNQLSLTDVKASIPSNSNKGFGSSGVKSSSSLPPPPTPGMSQGFAPSQYLTEPILDKVNITFKTTATYQQFIDFLQDIEMNLRIMDLSKLSIKVSDADTYDFDVEFQTYWLRQ
ncbi:MAG: hypothetical protein NT077_03035 [Candidatus Taylorbacteria bacterium]|nr:hypothetical protein [Candidatus Taylorbacteria bacterium]